MKKISPADKQKSDIPVRMIILSGMFYALNNFFKTL